ncbi:MAG: c-type cytochrome [Rhodospirillaceae bacterium]
MKNKLFVSVFASCILTLGLAEAQEPSAERGQKTYMRVGCYQCHGSDGQGNDAGTALTPDPLPPEAIANFIRYSPGRMPAYPEEVVSDAEIADMVAFLESVPPPPEADDIDILKNLRPGS